MEQDRQQNQQRGFAAPPVADSGLYSFANEHDACGVGLVADLNNQPSHRIVEMGLTVLKRLMHRGAAGGDPDTGDGAGLLLALPHEFFRREMGEALPEPGRYGVAMIFAGAVRSGAPSDFGTYGAGKRRADGESLLLERVDRRGLSRTGYEIGLRLPGGDSQRVRGHSPLTEPAGGSAPARRAEAR